MLFDTGATTTLRQQARTAIGDNGPAQRAASFIVASQFDRWCNEHPDWNVIEDADVVASRDGILHFAMIRVPEVWIASALVGPARFARRPDRSFHEWMSQHMSERIDGAIGANVFVA